MKHLIRITFEILFLVLIGSLHQFATGQQSLLKLDLHKQSQRTKSLLLSSNLATIDRQSNLIYSSSDIKERHKRQAEKLRRSSLLQGLANDSNLFQVFSITTTTTPIPVRDNDETATTTTTTSMPTAPAAATTTEFSAAELCYLSNGGSSLTLTVNEATQVGALVGTIEVNGEPALEGGNVDLEVVVAQELQSPDYNRFAQITSGAAAAAIPSTARHLRARLLGRRDTSTGAPTSSLSAPLRLEPGTKELVLARALDKESAEGESSLVVNVRCRARANGNSRAKSSTLIPIRLIITDANDQAPEFVGAQPYVIQLSETTPAGSPLASREILAVDRDSAGPHSTLHYHVLENSATFAPPILSANYSHLAQHFAFTNPLEPVLWLTSSLDYESLPAPSFTLTIVAQDQAEPEPLQSSAQVQVNVLDFDDQNPRFLDEKYTLVMDELQANLVGENLRVLPRNLRAEDGDRGIMAPIMYSFDATREDIDSQSLAVNNNSIQSYLHLNPTSGDLRLIRQWPPSRWTSGGTLTLVVRATQVDNRDRYALTTLTITRATGSGATVSQLAGSGNRVAFLENQVSVQVAEDAPISEKIARVKAHHAGDEHRSSRSKASAAAAAAAATTTKHSPITYQILDDQTDQFSINELGEISLKRALDYEQRQEFKFRVLATDTQNSDICQLQVNVSNVNDNKPKFTQSQYIFHLNESRLRHIGSIQAHDADLNDPLSYSLVTPPTQLNSTGSDQQCARLFDVHPTTGQLSLRANIRQLNVSACQLIVQVSDSLNQARGQPAPHTQQARVSVYVAPTIIGRSINLFAGTSEPPEQEARSFGGGGGSSPVGAHYVTASTRQRHRGATDSHHLRAESSSTTETLLPVDSSYYSNGSGTGSASNQRSSMATVMASFQHMVRSLNFTEMPMSSALLLSVLLAFLVCLLLIIVISMSVHVYRRRSKTRRRRHLTAVAHLRHAHMAAAAAVGAHNVPSNKPSSSSCSTSSTPTQPSPTHSSHRKQRPAYFDNLGLSATSVAGAVAGTKNAAESSLQTDSTQANEQDSPTPPSSKSGRGSRAGNLQELRISTSGEEAANRQPATTYIKSVATGSGGSTKVQSLISSLTSSTHSAPANREHNSMLSTDDDDDNSSAMNCGHYSVNGTIEHKRRQMDAGQAREPMVRRGVSSVDMERQQTAQQNKSSIEAAIRNLVREQQQQEDDDDDESSLQLANKFKICDRQAVAINRTSSTMTTTSSEVTELTSSKPGMKSYRRLPLMNSLVRPVRSQFGAGGAKVAPLDYDATGGLMALVRDSGQQHIKWPAGATPQRTKRLTWDDELSCHDELSRSDHQQQPLSDDCYIAPHIQLAGPISPLGFEHHYSSPIGVNGQMAAAAAAAAANNCLVDYTIVQSSQFRADSLAGATANNHAGDEMNYLYNSRQEVEQQQPHYYYEQSLTNQCNNNNLNEDDANPQTHKLTQNYQDLKLMTTAVL